MSATAIYHDGRNNFQVNYGGDAKQVQTRFNEEMTSRNVVWARLFVEKTGEPLAVYHAKVKTPPSKEDRKQIVNIINAYDALSLEISNTMRQKNNRTNPLTGMKLIEAKNALHTRHSQLNETILKSTDAMIDCREAKDKATKLIFALNDME
jgi:hypothetical protein